MGRGMLLFTACFEHSVGFRSGINANLMQDVFSHERRKASIRFGSGFQFPAKLVARLVHGRWQPLDTKVGSISFHSRGNSTHVPNRQRSKKRDTIDYFLVSTLIRPLIQKREIVKSVPWGPHYELYWLNINFESVVSRQLIGSQNTNALQGQNTNHTEEADPALWSEARRKCVFEGKKPAFKTDRKTPMHVPNVQERVVSWKRHMSWAETWSDATIQCWMKVGRMSQITLSGKFATFRM